MIDRHLSWVSWTAAVTGGVILVVAVVFAVHIAYRNHAAKLYAAEIMQMQSQAATALAPLKIPAAGVAVFDATNNVLLYGEHADQIFPIASVTKLATAITALQVLPADTAITVATPLTAPLDPINTVLPAGKTFSLQDLLVYMLAVSSNDTASLIAKKVTTAIETATNTQQYFPVYAVQTLTRLGIAPWYTGSESGLDGPTDPTVYASPIAVVGALRYFVSKYPAIADMLVPRRDMTIAATDGTVYHFQHTLFFDGSVSSGIVFAKTGYTDEAHGALAFIVRHAQSNHMIIVVLLDMARNDRLPEAIRIEKALQTLVL